MYRMFLLGFVVVALTSCDAVKASFQVQLSPETLKMVKAQPEFADVQCPADTRIALAGAEVTRGSLLLSINCVDF